MKKRVFGMSIIGLVLLVFGCASNSWLEAKKVNTIAGYREFLEQYSDSEWASDARERIDLLEWEAAEATNSVDAYEEYLRKYPNSHWSYYAKQNLIELRWGAAVSENSIASYENFISKHPNHSFAEFAKARVATLREQLMEEKLIAATREGIPGLRKFITEHKGVPGFSGITVKFSNYWAYRAKKKNYGNSLEFSKKNRELLV